MELIYSRYKSIIRIDLDKFNDCYNKVETGYCVMTRKEFRRKAYTFAKLKKLFKELKLYECNYSKEEILAEITNPDLRKAWEEYYEQA